MTPISYFKENVLLRDSNCKRLIKNYTNAEGTISAVDEQQKCGTEPTQEHLNWTECPSECPTPKRPLKV